MEWELESLLIPEVDAAKEAGRLLADMPRLWAGSTLQERHQLLTTILDAVYIEMKDEVDRVGEGQTGFSGSAKFGGRGIGGTDTFMDPDDWILVKSTRAYGNRPENIRK